MVDEKGTALPPELLADMPSIPNSLEYINWETDDGNLLYRLERSEGKTVAALYDLVRTTSRDCVESWTDKSILRQLDQ